jgi:hypothetical protein
MPSTRQKLSSTAAIAAKKRPVPPRTRPKADRSTAAAAPDPAGAFEGDALWGASQIAGYMRISRASFYYLWNSGKLDGVITKIGHRTLCASRRKLDALVAGELDA